MQNECNRLKWFKAHVGRRVYRTNNGCACKPCATVYEEGLIVRNQTHALHLRDSETQEETVYFGTSKERDEYVNKEVAQVLSQSK